MCLYSVKLYSICLSDKDFCFYTQQLFMLLQYRRNHIFQELFYLNGGASHIFGRIHRLFQLVECEIKCRILCNQFQKVVVFSFSVINASATSKAVPPSGATGWIPSTFKSVCSNISIQ